MIAGPTLRYRSIWKLFVCVPRCPWQNGHCRYCQHRVRWSLTQKMFILTQTVKSTMDDQFICENTFDLLKSLIEFFFLSPVFRILSTFYGRWLKYEHGALTFILTLFRDILISHIHKQNNTFKFWGKSYCIFYCNENQYFI